jgi:hypothetical protein
MTIEIGSQKVGRMGRRGGARVPTQLPIGETDANIFACPACSRPLGTGTKRCPGCSTRLIAGVKLTRAAGFMAVGLTIGVILSSGVMTLMSAVARPADVVVPVAPPVVTPTQMPIPSAPALVVDPGIPSQALSALRQSTLLNQRVLTDADRLAAALGAAKPSSREIAPILRTLATTASFGARLAGSVADWDEGVVVSQDLATFYAEISGAAEDGLSSSLANTRAYVAAGEQMLKVLAGLDAIDAASRALAASADLELPPLTKPSS